MRGNRDEPEGIFPPIELEGDGRDVAIGELEGAGGRRLRYRVVAAPRPSRTLLYLHGIESHGAWFLPAAMLLRRHGVTTILLDRRGSGLNRDTDPGDAASSGVLLEDIRRCRDALGDPRLHLVGLSWGGKLALAAALDRPQGVDGVILITPGLRALVDLSFAQKLHLLLSLVAGGRCRLKVPIRPEMFTETPRFLEFIRRDPWRLEEVTARFLLSSRALDLTIRRRLRELRAPVLLLLAGRDRIVDNPGVLELLSPLGDRRLRVRWYPEAMHSLQFDQLESVASELQEFLSRQE